MGRPLPGRDRTLQEDKGNGRAWQELQRFLFGREGTESWPGPVERRLWRKVEAGILGLMQEAASQVERAIASTFPGPACPLLVLLGDLKQMASLDGSGL